MTELTPSSFRELVSRWRAAGSPEQPGILWPQTEWCRDFPEHRTVLERLPRSLNRQAVREVCAEAERSPNSAQVAFVVTMAWGFGNRGYGRHRTARILAATPGASKRLHAAALALRANGALHAYRRMSRSGDSHLSRLGPAFATKFLAFCSPDERRPALIFDSFVAAWLSEHTAERWRGVVWDERLYGRYLEFSYRLADELEVLPEDIERLMFLDEATRRGSQWGADSGAS